VTVQDADRLFLQAFLSRRVISEQLANFLWERCIDAAKSVNEDLEFPRSGVGEVIHRLQQKLQPLGMDIKVVGDEYSDNICYTVVNIQGDGVAEIATNYAQNEVQFFKAVVEQIMLAKNEAYCIGSMAALRVAGGMKRAQAEKLLKSFVHESWLAGLDGGHFALGTRALAELETYLKNHYEDLGYFECVICHSIITRGLRCCHAQCQTRIHHRCFAKYNTNQRQYVCPSCRQDWSEEHNRARMAPIGIEAFREGQDDRTMKRPQPASGESDEETEEGDAVDVDPSQSQEKEDRPAPARTKGSRAKAGGSRQRASVADEDEE